MGTAHLKLEKLESECEVREIIEVRFLGGVTSSLVLECKGKRNICIA